MSSFDARPTVSSDTCTSPPETTTKSTAKLYGDVSFLTCNEELAADAGSFFNAITGYSQPQEYRKIATAPFDLRDKLLELIDSEIARCRQGQRAYIMAQLNSLACPKIIAAPVRGIAGRGED